MSSQTPSPITSITLVGPPSPGSGSGSGSGSIELKRAQADADLVPICRSEVPFLPYPPPPEHPQLPVPLALGSCHCHLTLQLTDIIDDGGSSVVYAATAIHSDDSNPSDQAYPPLVVKIARRNRRGHIAREAWFYDELHALQGSVIPRCYGWFEAPETSTFVGDVYAPDNEEEEGEEPNYYPEPWTDALGALAKEKGYISVLVLERLGGRIPMGVPLSTELQEDAIAIGDSLGAHYVHIADIRHANILHTLSDPHALPSQPSPVTGRVHEWRVIDLESCQKCDQPPHALANAWESWVRTILESLPEGYTVEPWDY